MYRKIWMIGLVGLVVGVVPALAQFGKLQGTAKGEDGKPLVNAVISIDREDIKGHFEVKTDKNGNFFHGGLPLGRYTISLLRNGGNPFSFNGVQVRMSEPAVVDFDLEQERLRTEAQAAGIQVEEQPGGKLSEEQLQALAKASKEREEQIKKRQELVNHYNAGVAALQAKDYDTAISELELAAQTDPNQDVLYAQLGEAFKAKAGLAKADAEKKEWSEKSLQAYQKSLELKPTDASYHNNFALALASAGRMEEAQAALLKAAQLDPPNGGRYYFNLGAMLVNTNHPKEASDAFRKAIEMDPKYADAYYQLGITLTGLASVDSSGKVTPVEGTVEALQKYLELAPNGPNAAAAKDLLGTLGGAVTTTFTREPAGKK
ncbi:MAG: tetratricopeptide repeat protein [Acidobacteria bacterium]|nr:tetratricopeptide repeat protein [Acidobacteriota bacterium]